MFGQKAGDARMDINVEVHGIIFDTVRCSAYIDTRSLSSITLASNFMYVRGSAIHWVDEASHGMCTHLCTKSETRALYEILKGIDLQHWIRLGNDRKVTPQIKDTVLKMISEYLEA